jgi:hypothetical protein
MRPWASWTAKTAVFSLAAGLAATAAGSAAWAAPGSGANAALAARGSTALSARSGAIGSGQVTAQAGRAGDVCLDAGALLGIVGTACQSVPLVDSPAPAQAGQSAADAGRAAASQGPGQGTSGQGTSGRRASGQGASGQGAARGSGQDTARNSSQDLAATVGQVIQRAVAPVTAVLGAGGSPLETVPAPLTAVAGAPSSRSTGADGASAPGTDRTSSPPAARAGDTNVPAATQLAGLGALPGLADLPPAGPASTPARNGAPGGGIPMPGTALSAASSGVSSDSFAVLAVGALLAGASALKIAGRRSRDRKAGIGVVVQ